MVIIMRIDPVCTNDDESQKENKELGQNLIRDKIVITIANTASVSDWIRFTSRLACSLSCNESIRSKIEV
jgi:hypothetical protein